LAARIITDIWATKLWDKKVFWALGKVFGVHSSKDTPGVGLVIYLYYYLTIIMETACLGCIRDNGLA